MKVLCAPDKFKESLSAFQAAQAMARGVRWVRPDAEVDICPVADGGEGTVDALLAATHGQARQSEVTGPCGTRVMASWGLLGIQRYQPLTAVLEMAGASGLALVPPAQRDPARTTSLGTGQLMAAALDAGAQCMVLGIGGSATNDGGAGMAQALGVCFFDVSGREMDTPLTGGVLERIHRLDLTRLDPRLASTPIIVACDVTNPLTGPYGATRVYGPQKGARPEQLERLDSGLEHLACLWREQLGLDLSAMPGAGAAGGLGAGLVAFCGAKLERGVELVLRTLGFDERVAGCSLCLTGEGRFDGQSLQGKACLGVAAAAKRHGVKTVALVGSLGSDVVLTDLAQCRVIGPGLSTEQSMRQAAQLVERAAAEVVGAWSQS